MNLFLTALIILAHAIVWDNGVGADDVCRTETYTEGRGNPCYFPFLYGGNLHDGCIGDESYSWCSTESVHSNNNWGKCTSNCRLDGAPTPATITTTTTTTTTHTTTSTTPTTSTTTTTTTSTTTTTNTPTTASATTTAKTTTTTATTTTTLPSTTTRTITTTTTTATATTTTTLTTTTRMTNRAPETSVTKNNCVLGSRVKRGKDWRWGSQDHVDSHPALGKIVNCAVSDRFGDGGVRVKWDNGQQHTYRIGADGKSDLYFALQQPTRGTTYDKITNRYCYTTGMSGRYKTLDEATDFCSVDSNCKYVYDDSCDDTGDFKLCSKDQNNQTRTSNKGSCIYEKKVLSDQDLYHFDKAPGCESIWFPERRPFCSSYDGISGSETTGKPTFTKYCDLPSNSTISNSTGGLYCPSDDITSDNWAYCCNWDENGDLHPVEERKCCNAVQICSLNLDKDEENFCEAVTLWESLIALWICIMVGVIIAAIAGVVVCACCGVGCGACVPSESIGTEKTQGTVNSTNSPHNPV